MTWPQVEVLDIKEGAAYEGVVYDQDLVVRMSSGRVLRLFDMSPMIAGPVHIAESLEVVVAVAVPTRVRPGQTSKLKAMTADYESRQWDAVRTDLPARTLSTLDTPDGDFVIAQSELPHGLSVGQLLDWDDARYDLLAWRRRAVAS